MDRIDIDDVIQIADTVLTPQHLVIAAVGTLSRARLGELRQVITDWR